MFKRIIQTELVELANAYPVITLLGPRQSGKTTLVQMAFSQKPYVSLEDPDTRQLANSDPRGFLQQYPNGAILDEIQRIPSLLSYIQTIVDKTQQKGLYILTGSHQLALHQAISQSLAGRTALLTLWPLSIKELTDANIQLELDDYLLKGFFPRIHHDQLNPTKAYRNYFQTYIERDVRQLLALKDLNLFQNFVRLCAGRIGQILNFNSLGNELGVSSHTIKEWISTLEASFIIFRLTPYFENFGKRIIKSPKLYFTDVGLATYLLGIENITQLQRDPLRGYLIENMVLLELYKARLNQGLDPQLFYYRDNNQNEVDVIFKTGNHLVPIEVKASKTFHADFLKGLKYFKNLVGNRAQTSFLIYAGDQEQQIAQTQLLNFKHVVHIFE